MELGGDDLLLYDCIELVARQTDKLVGMSLTKLNWLVRVCAVRGDHLDSSDVWKDIAVPTLTGEDIFGYFDG